MLATAGDNNETITGRSEPKPTATVSTPRVLTIISNVIDKLVDRNDRLLLHRSTTTSAGVREYGAAGKSLEAFQGVRAPSISIQKYLERIYKYTNCSPACFVVGYVYIDRLAHKHPGSLVASLNVHRLLVTCVMVASKMLDDVHCSNAFYARVGGVSTTELNRLELELLFLLDFGVTVNSRAFEIYCFHLEKSMPLNGTVPNLPAHPPLQPQPPHVQPTRNSFSFDSSLSSALSL